MATTLRGSCPYCGNQHSVQLEAADASEAVELSQAASTSGAVEVGTGAVGEMVQGGIMPCTRYSRD